MLDFHELPGHLIRRLHQISVSVFTDKAAEAGFDLTPVQYAALSAVRANPGLDQATLAGHIAYDRVTIGGVVDRLVQKELLVRQVNPDDRRARKLVVSDAGAEILDGLEPVIATVQDEILTGLDDAERSLFLDMLKKTTTAGNQMSRAPLKFAK